MLSSPQLSSPRSLCIPSAESLAAEIAKQSLPDFIRLVWPIVEPDTELVWNWHLDAICDVLQSMSRGELSRVIINIPPGCGKSLIVSVLWPAHEWASNPSYSYLTASYSDANTIRDNRRLRSIITSAWYQRHYKTRLSSDQSAKIRFDTTDKGWRIATSVGGAGTGEHPNRVIIDDPIKAKDARSDVALENCNQWMDRTISTRIAKQLFACLVVMQRLHENDLSGHLLAKGGWEHVKFPMRYVASRPRTLEDKGYEADVRDRRSRPGELLWPALWTEAKVRQEELDLGPFQSSGQLQQTPIPEGGGLFKREWFRIVDSIPAGKYVRRCRGWDTADTLNGGDWTIGARISSTPDGVWYVEHVIRTQSSSADVNRLILNTAKSDGKRCLIREGSGSGKATISARSRMLVRYDYGSMPETRTEDKQTRAAAFRTQCEMGNVVLVGGEWNEAFLDVLSSFPVGRYDDDVDAISHAFNAIVATKEKTGRVAVRSRRYDS